MRRFSEASPIVAPPVQALEGAFQTMVVSEASTSPAAFSRRSAVAAEAAHEEPAAFGAAETSGARLGMRSGPAVREAAGPVEGEAEMLA